MQDLAILKLFCDIFFYLLQTRVIEERALLKMSYSNDEKDTCFCIGVCIRNVISSVSVYVSVSVRIFRHVSVSVSVSVSGFIYLYRYDTNIYTDTNIPIIGIDNIKFTHNYVSILSPVSVRILSIGISIGMNPPRRICIGMTPI